MTDINIEKYISELIDDNEIKEEITNFFNNIDNNEQCYFTAGDFQITPTIDGLSFLGNYSFPTIINMLIPDLFTKCMTSHYNTPIEKSIFLSKSCPVYSNTFSIKKKNIDINNLSIHFYYQKIINKELIKSLLYFNFSSNFMKISSLKNRLIFLSKRVNIYLESKINNINYANHTKPEEIFYEIYDKDSLIVQLLDFKLKLQEVLNTDKNGINICKYNIPYVFTYYCINNIDKNILLPLSSVTSDRTLYSMSYSDLFYLSNAKWALPLLISNLQKLFNTRIPSDEIENFIYNIKQSNIFTIFEIVDETFNEIITQISNILQKKTTILSSYENNHMLLKCLKLYYNYVSNEIFLINNSGVNEHISNIYLDDIKNFIKYVINLINN